MREKLPFRRRRLHPIVGPANAPAAQSVAVNKKSIGTERQVRMSIVALGPLPSKPLIPNSRDSRVDPKADVPREIWVARRHQRAQAAPTERQAIRIANSLDELPRTRPHIPHCNLMSHVATTGIDTAAQVASGSEESRSANWTASLMPLHYGLTLPCCPRQTRARICPGRIMHCAVVLRP